MSKATSFDFQGQEGDYIEKYINLLLPFMKVTGGFTLHDTIRVSSLGDDDKSKARQLYYEIRTCLVNQFGYAKDHPEFDSDILLTPKGIEHRQNIINMASMLNVGSENHDYDDLNESSSMEEKLSVAITVLSKEHSHTWLHYRDLYITPDKERLFDARLKDTGFVTTQKAGNLHPAYRISDEGLLLLDQYGTFLKYLESKKEE